MPSGLRALPLLAACTLAACGGETVAETTDPVAILSPQDVAVATRGSVNSSVTLTGTLEPFRRADLTAQVPGMVSEVTVNRGDAVEQGQRLARIQAAGITSQVAGAQSQVAAARSNEALARRQYQSARKLYEAGAMAEIDFRAAQAQYETAQSQVNLARTQVTGAAEQAARTSVTAPFSGEISAKIINVGEAVNPGAELFTLVNSAYLDLHGQVPVAEAVRVREGQPAEFTLDAYPGRTLRGIVSRVDPVADPATRQVGVVMRLDNRNRSLLAGLFATGRVLTGTSREVVLVPASALRNTGAESSVWVVANNRLVERKVSVGERDETRNQVAVLSGLQAGEQVITAPGNLKQGTPVRVGNAAAALIKEDK